MNLHREWADALRRNDFKRAWKLNDTSLAEYRLSGAVKHSGERHLQRIWRGEDLKNRSVLVRCYHGLGDTIQFIRFAKPLREVAREVIVWSQPELLSLVRRVDGVDRVLPLHDGTPDASFDVDIEVMELAHALRATPQLVTGRVPYLPRVARKEPPSSRLSIGVVWEAGNWNPSRSVPARLFARLLEQSDVRLLSLQQGPARALAKTIPAEDVAVTDIEMLAARIMQLDLVITVDTMVAHLAGALGIPVWTMLHRDCDWRWPETGRYTVWYPTMRLFHQKTAGDWTGVMEKIIDELRLFRRRLPTRQDAAAQYRSPDREGVDSR
ncbi:MAG TPA: glycosyltransferase family 9 protein [Bradyrhizobium sp.]|uniref:glycosyltransferase family 9 protein n=1 Tax=Bradyrhizobium sp. TaxID=376 RepID=UPI002B476514|nr:glycosyltransferase family 9 protein [Bradyrhizobium sp.]HKO71697.1 glycosyltransferase family 9 protein [Bradyrhizobium sp.]